MKFERWWLLIVFLLSCSLSKTLPVAQKNVMDLCVKIVNYIQGKAWNHKLFKAFLQ